MANITKNIVDIDENLRLLGTAHVSKTSVNLVREQINLPADIQTLFRYHFEKASPTAKLLKKSGSHSAQ